MSRYTLRVRADRKAQVEAIISKIPSHYVKAWVITDRKGTTQYSVPTRGATEVLLPVGQLASLVAESTKEGVKPAWYLLSGEFNGMQLQTLKRAMVATLLVKDTTWQEAEGEDGAKTLAEGIGAI